MAARPFRFGASIINIGTSRSVWHARAREIEGLGYDVLLVNDHLGMAAPFPALVSAADVTGMRLGTYVLNAGVQHPAYLAREVADAHRLTEGRLELGLGAGYVEHEFTAAGLPFGTPGSRLRRLQQVLAETKELLLAEPDRPLPPIMIAAAGDRLLEYAARTADIISFPITAGFGPGTPEEALARRVDRVRTAAGDRFADLELNLFVAAVGAQVDDLDLSIVASASGRPAEELVDLPGVLVGSPRQIADKLGHYRDTYGISYVSVLEPHMHLFAEVIPLLR
ncbi:TIGR03621 family F420-dependent LLM class oxidoreductase [Asanoa siamensis]|uniref:LLM class F420-dependent oxidoreductase n=1 Tax=Asanoa siamensis TaxID=926357 RepID=A0ABQ4CYZ4_9ACTN|nr:TIGR03621 family F420-dependent LLM class oxidoreductase [Asanoa siamensis]GIF76513.1 LLM class F420-dependent oxidoreductase [Asanoa siamensis]